MSKKSNRTKYNSPQPQSTTKDSTSPIVRTPVVSVLGHVDHGKTSLLDQIRKSNIQTKEAGGITQSIGAYQVEHQGRMITFIDTPGHEAFTAMRARGGAVADIVVLVVAANEGVKPQTIESIGHAQAAEVPIIVALNKIDLAGADVMRVKQELATHGIVTEDLGGTVVAVEVSAKTGQGVDQLLEMISLVGDVSIPQSETTENDSSVHGIIIESRRDPKIGVVATGIVKQGILNPGTIVVTESAHGKLKRITDWKGNTIDKAHEGMPVEMLGFERVPGAGERFVVVASERDIQTYQKEKLAQNVEPKPVVEKIVPLIIKASTQGSLEAFRASLEALADEDSRVEIVHAGLSTINEADVTLASVSRAIILGFNVSVDAAASSAAEIERVPIMSYDVIYHALEDVADLLDSEVEKIRAVGEALVQQVFVLSNGTHVAGSKILDGHLTKGARIQVVRGDEVVFESRIASIRHEKDERSKVEAGTECGIILSKDFEFVVGDSVLVFGQ